VVPAVEDQAPIRVLLAIGDAERERRLLEGLSGDGLVVAVRCLDGPSLAEQAAANDVDVALASTELHRLTIASLIAVQEARLPLVLMAEAAEASRYRGLAHLLPRTAGPLEISQALQAAVRNGPSYAPVSPGLPSAPDSGSADREGTTSEEGRGDAGRVIVVLSGKGAPGATTVAIALAAALAERGRRTALLDADLSGGNVGAYLDLDPRRGLFALAYGREAGQEGWERRVEEELQDGPGFLVLNGIERAEQRSTVSVDVLTTAIAALRRSFEDVVVDAGAVTPGLASGATDAFLRGADRLLLVANGDVVALWNAQAALRHLLDGLGVSPADTVTLAVMGVVQLGVPYLLFSKGLEKISLQEASLIVLIEPVLNPIWVALTVGEVPSKTTLAGGSLIIFGLGVRYLLQLRGTAAISQ